MRIAAIAGFLFLELTSALAPVAAPARLHMNAQPTKALTALGLHVGIQKTAGANV